MIQQLKNIFVPYNVAKLAFEKGFTEWCSAIQALHDSEPSPNAKTKRDGEHLIFTFDHTYLSDDSDEEYGLPTHFQLIVWLKDKHDIDVTMQINGLWVVIGSRAVYEYFNGENEFEINQALEVALNLLPNYEHDKQEYL